MKPLEIVIVILGILPLVSCNLIIYPAANGAPTSGKFHIFLSQGGQKHQSHVYITSSQHRTRDASHVKGGRTMSWTSFAFTGGAVTVEVHAPQDFKNCLVRPTRYGFKCHRTGPKVAQFSVTSNTKMMSVEFDYDYGHDGHDITDKLMVFADPPEGNRPNKNDNSVLYYGTGVHNLNGQKELAAHIKEIYLEPGAWISGGFRTADGHASVKLHGRGVIDNSDYKWHDDRFHMATIEFSKGSGHTINGITLSDSMAFFIRALGDHNTIHNVKMVGAWINNNDGIATGHDGVITDTFVHANDDAIKLYSDGMQVHRCVVWQGLNGGVFQTGWYKGRDMQHVKVSDVDVIHTDWCAFKGNDCSTSGNNAVLNQAGDTQTFKVSDIELKNIHVEGSCPRIIYFKMHQGAHGTVTNVRFINWNVDSQPTHDSHLHNEIAGTGNTGHVTNWLFQNFRIGGHCISNPKSADFIIDAHTTSGIHFECGGTPVG